MKLVLAAAALASSLVPAAWGQAAAAPVPPPVAAAASGLDVIHKVRNKLIGKWINIGGEVIVFTDGGAISVSYPDMPKELTGTFVVTEDLQLKVSTGNAPVVSEFSVDSGLLRIKNKSGNFSEYQRYDHRNLADLTLRELKILDSALDQWAIENAKPEGARATPADLRKYINKKTRLFHTLNDATGPKDLLGNPFADLVINKGLKVNPTTARALSDAVPRSFWERYIE